MGRAPCCDKANVKKGPWSPEEDAKLKSYIEQHGTGGNWIALPQKIGLKRCGKSCRLRWLNYLRPNIKHGSFSEEEDNIICSLYISIGSRWSIIAAQLPGRTDNDIKNYWNTRLKKKLLGKQRKEKQSGKGSGLKQGIMKKDTTSVDSMHNIVATNDNNINKSNILENPCWPELPVLDHIPYSNQDHQPRLNDHNSIRKLLIKLGGRFSDDHLVPSVININNPHDQLPNGITSYTSPSHQFYGPSSNIGGVSSNSASVEGLESVANNNNGTQFAQSGFVQSGLYQGDDEAAGLQFLQGQTNYTNHNSGLEEMVFSDNGAQKLDGLEFLLGDDAVVNYNTTFRIDETSAGLCSLVYPPAASSSEGIHYQGRAFERGLRYPGSI